MRTLNTTRRPCWTSVMGTVFILLALLCDGIFCQCNWPAALQSSSWYRGSDSIVLVFGTSDVTNHKMTDRSSNVFSNFICWQSENEDTFVLRDPQAVHENPQVTAEKFYVNFCWKLVKQTASTYLLYELTDKLSANDLSLPNARAVKQKSTDLDPAISSVCTLAFSAQTPTVLFKVPTGASDLDPASIASASQPCPEVVQGTFKYVKDSTGCSGADSFLDLCTDKSAPKANYTVCSTEIFYSKNGVVSCMFDFTLSAGDTYILLANKDPENVVDHTTYYRFSCMKYTTTTIFSQRTESAVVYAGDCTNTGTSQTLELDRIADCPVPPVPEEGTNLIPIIAGAVGGFVFIVLVVVIIILVIKIRARRKARAVTPISIAEKPAQNGTVAPKAEDSEKGDGPPSQPPEEETPRAIRLPPLGGGTTTATAPALRS